MHAHSMNAVEFHERMAPVFENKYQSSKAFQERFRVWTALFDQYVRPTDRVVDLGCGTGIFSDYIASKGCNTTGIDGSAAMIALCQQRKTAINVRFIQSTLPLIDATPYQEQDVVLMSSFLEYVTEPTIMLQQANRLLRPNGLLFVSIPNQKSVYRRMERILFRLLKQPAYYAHCRYVAAEKDFTAYLQSLGFEVCEVVYFSGQDLISRRLRPWFAEPYVNTLFVGVYRKITAR